MVVRVCRVASVLLLLAIPLIAASTQPPRDLKLLRNHWTPYASPDPATYPAGAKVHTIVKGDTLWDLAKTYYGDPHLWPQIWEKNQYVTDAHWIYPGDSLLIEQEVTPTSTVTTEPEAAAPSPEEPAAPAPESGPKPSPPRALGNTSDIYCFGYLGKVNEVMPNEIAAFEDTDIRYVSGAIAQDIGGSQGDVVFIKGGTATGIQAGQTYVVVKPGKIVHHPRTGAVIGRHYAYTGQVKVLCASEDQATAVITESCTGILVGEKLKPLPQIAIPVARVTAIEAHCETPASKAKGFIVNAKDYSFSLGVGDVVEVNLGQEDFIQPGDFLTVYRENRIPGEPRRVLGQVGILTTEAHTATGRIVQMLGAMTIGDRVEVR